jgi:hypothetical protein
MPKILEILNTVLPPLIQIYKEYREANPDQPALTDDQIIELLRGDSQEIVNKANAWLAAHPPQS